MNTFKLVRYWLLILFATINVACGATARLAVENGVGPNPSLPAPETSLIPTVNVVTAVGFGDL